MLPAVFALVVACEREEPSPPAPTGLTLTQVDFADLPGWTTDDLAAALPPWRRSCARLAERPADSPVGDNGWAGTADDWRAVCTVVATARDDADLRRQLPRLLTPYLVSDGATADGTITGYYEPLLRGARTRGGAYQVPIHGPPADIVSVDLGAFDEALAGKRVVGRVDQGRLVPFHDRGAIQNGAINETDVLYWVDDAIDAFELHVQGSGRIDLAGGDAVRVGYAGNNGFDYTSVARWLIDNGEIPANKGSFDDIRDWIEANPARAGDLLAINKRYIFFRDLDRDGTGPIGAAGLELTAGRSLAIDRAFLPLNVPLWLATDHPDGALNRLVIAQDTGNAITGVVRGDFYWGSGAAARLSANRTRSTGNYYVLLPRDAPGPAAIGGPTAQEPVG